MNRWIALSAALVGALLLGWSGTRTPGASEEPGASTTISTAAFSTSLAMDDIRQMSRAPHPIGSAENARVRAWLVGRMTQLGLSPEIQAGDAVDARDWGGETWIVGGPVKNVVGVFPGKDRSKPALALMAHYDSVPASPGAADDATGVAVALDVVRALKARGAPERDVIVIITDGEEAGLLGARLFFAEHPLRKRIGLLINMESRGNGGRANMFQTGPDNGAVVAAFAKTAYRPISNSLAVFLYENMPNDTDFTVSKEAGIRGLNFAFIGRQFDYHAATATPANLDEGSVRHMGVQALAAAAGFAFAAELPGKAPDAVYSQTFGDHILAYPAWAGWIVVLLAGGLIAWAATRARRAGALPYADVARGAGASLFLLLAAALALHVVRRATGVDFGFLGQRPLLAQWALWETTLAILATGALLLVPALLARGVGRLWPAAVPLALGLLSSLFGGWDMVGAGLGAGAAAIGALTFGRGAGGPGAWLGALLLGLVVAVGLQATLPAVAVIVAWPLTLAAAGAAATRLGDQGGLPRAGLLALLAALGGGWLAVYFHGVAQGLDMPAILGLFPWLAGLLFWPLAAGPGEGRRGLAPATALLTVGVVLLVVVRFTDPWSPRHPQATGVFHVTDRDTGKAWRVADTPDLDDWSRAVLTAEGGKVGMQAFKPLTRGETWAAPARALPAAPAMPAPVTIERPAPARLELVARPGRVIMLDVSAKTPADAITAVTINGKPVALKGKPGAVRLRWQGADRPLALVLTTGQASAPKIRYGIVGGGWPADAAPLPARPADVMPFNYSDSTVVVGSLAAPVASRPVPTQEPRP